MPSSEVTIDGCTRLLPLVTATGVVQRASACSRVNLSRFDVPDVAYTTFGESSAPSVSATCPSLGQPLPLAVAPPVPMIVRLPHVSVAVENVW